MTRRRRILMTLGGLAVVLVLGWWGTSELIYSRHLPPAVKERMPGHWGVPWGLRADVRAAIDDLYSGHTSIRIDAANRLGNLGPDAAPAVPYLVALLADDPQPQAPSSTPPSLIDRILDSLCPAKPQAADEAFYLSPPCDPAAYSLIDIGEPAEDPCIAALKDPDPKVRFNAAQVLGEIGDRRAALPLIAVLQEDRVPAIRARAAEALGQIGDPQAVAALVRDLNVTRKCPANTVVEALGRIGDPQAVEPLMEYYRECHARRSNNSYLPGDAGPGDICLALLRCGDRGIQRVLDNMCDPGDPSFDTPFNAYDVDAAIPEGGRWTESPLLLRWFLKKLEEDDLSERYATVLKMLRPASAVKPLLAMLSRTDPPPQSDTVNGRYDQIVDVLGSLDDPPASRQAGTTADEGPRIADALLASLSRPEPHPSRLAVALALANRGDPRAVPLLVAEVGLPNYHDWSRMAEALGRFDTDEATSTLLGMLACYDKRGLQRAALAFWDRRDPRAAETLANSLELWLRENQPRPWPDGPEGALIAIGQPTVVHLLPLLKHDDKEVRGEAAYILGQIGDARAFDGLVELLSHDPDSAVHVAAARALGQLHDPRALEPLAEAMRLGPTEAVQRAAAEGLGYLRDTRANDILWARYLADAVTENGRPGDPFREPLLWTPVSATCLGALARANDERGLKALPVQISPDSDFRATVYFYAAAIDVSSESIDALVQAVRRNPRSITVAIRAVPGLFLTDDPAARQAAWDSTAPYPSLQDYFIGQAAHEIMARTAAAERTRRLLSLVARQDPDRMNRISAITALATIGDPPTRHVIEEAAAKDPSRIVRHSAQRWLLKWAPRDPDATGSPFYGFAAPAGTKSWQPDPPPETAP
jgi:HEAT repeat protein